MSQGPSTPAATPEAKRQLLAKLLQKKKEMPSQAPTSDAPQLEKPTLNSGIENLKQQHEWLDQIKQRNPYFRTLEGVPTPVVSCDGREIVNYASYNYLGLCGDKRMTQAAKDALDTYGTSVSASRIASGERHLHQQLEQKIAQFIGQEDALVFVGGYGTNETVISHICGPQDLILHDSYMHRSAIEGAHSSGARRIPFPHNDLVALEGILAKHRANYRQCLIVVEGLYSMDGDIVDLEKVVRLKNRFDALLYVDEAHSLGVLGKTGKGIAEHCNVSSNEIDFWMGTLSKTLASCGGAIAARKEIIDYLRYTTPGFVYSAGLTPANAAAALAALSTLDVEPERVQRIQKNSILFQKLCIEKGFDTGLCEGYAIVPVIVGCSEKAIALSNALFAEGINVQPIIYPAVPEKEARLRFFITSEQTQTQINTTLATLCLCLENLN